MGQGVPTLGEMEIEVLRLVWRTQPCTERTDHGTGPIRPNGGADHGPQDDAAARGEAVAGARARRLGADPAIARQSRNRACCGR